MEKNTNTVESNLLRNDALNPKEIIAELVRHLEWREDFIVEDAEENENAYSKAKRYLKENPNVVSGNSVYKLGWLGISGAVATQYIEHSEKGQQHVAVSDWDNEENREAIKKEAELIVEAVNNYTRLKEVAKEMQDALRGLTDNIPLSRLNIRKDFSLINYHANATKVLQKAKDIL